MQDVFIRFFYSRRHVEHLHSFPTRRSSDLDKAKTLDEVTAILSGIATVHITSIDAAARVADESLPAPDATLDRKSTRLNSSHMSISYAVFCLKKKKRKRQNTRRNLPLSSTL